MGFLNTAITQLADLFRSMTPAARITSGLLLMTIVVSIAYLVQYQWTGPEAYLLHGQAFTSEEVQRMETAFGKKGLNGYHVDGAQIRVPRGRRHEYLAALAEDNALPHNFGQFLEQALQDAGPFSSSRLTREKKRVAMVRELCRTIERMRDVSRAHVFFDEKEHPGLRDDDLATASVQVEPVGGKPLTAEQADNIRRLVVGAFAGLKLEHVHVGDNLGNVYESFDGHDNTAVGNRLYFAAKRQEEQVLRQKIMALLPIPNVRVSVTAELDDALRRSMLATEFKDAQRIASRSSTLESVLHGDAGGGRVGLQAQQQGANAAASLQNQVEPRSKTTESDEESRSVVPGTTTKTEFVGLTLKDASVSIAIPRSYYAKAWRQRQGNAGKEPTPANLQDEENLLRQTIIGRVDNLLPQRPLGQDSLPRVRVDTYEDLPPEALPASSLTEELLAWLQSSWSTLGMLALAAFSLLMLRSAMKVPAAALPAPPSASSAAGPPPASEQPEAQAPPTAVVKLRRLNEQGPSLRVQLAELVKEDPDAAATILKNWIGSSS